MRVEELELELRAERTEPDPEFARRLDEWAAAGFPRKREPGPFARLRARLSEIPPRRALLPAGALASLAVVAGVALSTQQSEIDPSSGEGAVSWQSGGDAARSLEAAPPPAAPATSAGGFALEAEGAESVPPLADEGASDVDGLLAPLTQDAGPRGRRIAQRVDLEMATSPEDFRDAADGVLDVVAEHRGFVVDSTVSGGDPSVRGAEAGRADFRLKIPASELPAALAALSELGHVVSRTDGTEDITGRFVGARQRIADLTQTRQSLLAQLEDATTENEQLSIRARLRIVEAQLEDAQDDLGAAQQRVSLVPVSVEIEANTTVAGDDDSDDSGWTLAEALDDAGDVLTTMAGILLVSLAILVPLGLIAALAWWSVSRLRRGRREAVLDQSS